ncbi:hypothetical protein DICPUDRAFT_83037 [Dictyostelium purpureum]|uniref:Uncharacterized protein n=1 Tax=Dictyostelium purpureum TaxID=5786 RepID=F0ZYC7_DICPU|nr:uncharacterized protein DICPUDRAFT_83037 [Dictyostelium purpureum]EGC31063.1 hypothetical protein DICPUDRAFT_83037 [Dictyostelium purpureum]|eukprot:XP_003292422.1 hypothetical protein DICPUDRAFT_83037 [Dictyostelium purpureum]
MDDAKALYNTHTVEHSEGRQILDSKTKNLIFLYGHGQNENTVEILSTILQDKNTNNDFIIKKLNHSNVMTSAKLFIKNHVKWSPCYNIIFYYSGKIQYEADETISLCSEDETGSLDEIYRNIITELTSKNNKGQLEETKLKLVFFIDSYDGSLIEDDASRLKITRDYLKCGSKLPKCSHPYGVMTLPRPFNNVSLRESLDNDLSPFANFLINRVNSIEFGKRLFYETANILASEFWSKFINQCSSSDESFLINVAKDYIDIHNGKNSKLNEEIKESIIQREFKILSNGNDSNVFMFKF